MKSASRVALKEWPSIIRAIHEGRQIILLRKGGLADTGGVFSMKEPEFFLYPSHLHEKPELLKADAARAERFTATVMLDTYVEAVDVLPLADERQSEFLSAVSVWTPEFVAQRFRYKPEIPVSLIVVRGWKLRQPVMVEETPAYAGCRSWVPLDRDILIDVSGPSLPDHEFERQRAAMLNALEGRTS